MAGSRVPSIKRALASSPPLRFQQQNKATYLGRVHKLLGLRPLRNFRDGVVEVGPSIGRAMLLPQLRRLAERWGGAVHRFRIRERRREKGAIGLPGKLQDLFEASSTTADGSVASTLRRVSWSKLGDENRRVD